MSKVTAKQIGEIGEYIAFQYLHENGYELVGFGKEMNKRTKATHSTANLPTLPDLSVAHSYGQFGLILSAPNLDWLDSRLPSWADLKPEQIQQLATECRETSVCPMKDDYPDQAPCANIPNILEKDWLTGELPGETWSTTDGELPVKRHHRFEYCQRWFTRLLLAKHKSTPPYGKPFLLVNMLVTDYIQRAWYKHCDMKRPDIDFPGRSHPGRYDFVGHKDGKLCAIEVKVNSSKLNYWQIVRMNLLKRYGCEAFVLRVSITQDQLKKAVTGEEPEYLEIVTEDTFNDSSVPFPTDDEFIELLNYVTKSEQWQIKHNCYT